MKTNLRLLLMALLPVILLSCKDQIEEFYTVNEPVYMTYEDLRSSFKVADGQDIIQPGKIYFKDKTIFVNEYQKGIHVIDNSNPADPQIVKFIEIPGNVDMAVKDNILYADSYIDLIAIDISDLNDIKVVKRIEDAFPYMVPEYENGVNETVDQTKGVVMRWNPTERKVNIKDENDHFAMYPTWERGRFFSVNSELSLDMSSSSGTAGSMARFTLNDEYLYAVDASMLRLFDISQAENPVKGSEVYVGWNIETIFPYEEKLFIGSTTGMFIYSLANPAMPQYVSTFWHVTGCDPVVVEGDFAYVTLRAGNLCGNNLSQLDVINISDINHPTLVKEYPMEEPYGLGIDNGVLFVCDGDAGLKIFDATNPLSITANKIAQYSDINAWDVIPLGEVLLMIGTDGLYQYDYSDIEDISLLSIIPIEKLVH